MFALSIAGCSTTGIGRLDPPPPFEPSEPAAPLPAFEFQVGTLEDGREVVFLEAEEFDRAETFVRHSLANRDALNARNQAFDDLADAAGLYWSALQDLDQALAARTWSCRLWIGAAAVAGIAVGL